MAYKYSKCPSCGGRRVPVKGNVGDIFTCKRCKAVFGECLLGESYEFVFPAFIKKPMSIETARYYDFLCLGENGMVRRHGWFDPETKLIVQAG